MGTDQQLATTPIPPPPNHRFGKGLLGKKLNDAETAYRRLYNFNAPMIRFLKDADIPVPQSLSLAVILEKAEAGEEDAQKWIDHFTTLCNNLSLVI